MKNNIVYILSFMIMLATTLVAQIPQEIVEELKLLSEEHLTIVADSINIMPKENMDNYLNVVVIASVKEVHRTNSKLQGGEHIIIKYPTRDPGKNNADKPMPAAPILECGKSYTSFLKLNTTTKVYELSVDSESFIEIIEEKS
ncbi:MAG: hypothetical protein PHR06_01825 [Candidatus Cloacimonetes bacterium]|nr:hypothetical protein [Candidatus Cloacimonadota bacterium]